MSSSAPNAEATRLVLTAVGASFAGAALAIGIMSRMLNNNNDGAASSDDQYNSMTQRKRSSSFIFEEPETSRLTRSGSSPVLFPHNHEEKMRRLVAARAAVDEENSLPRQSVTVRVPATSANMGPGCKLSCVCLFLFVCRRFWGPVCCCVMGVGGLLSSILDLNRIFIRLVEHRRHDRNGRRLVVRSYRGTQ